jgi:nitronate monooxygenase
MAHNGGWDTEAVRRLGIDLPIVSAPMGGGPSTPALVAAVSEAGGLGSLAGGYSSPDRLRADIAAVRAATSKPFAVNLFAPTPAEPTDEQLEAGLAATEPYRQELDLPARLTASGPWAEDFDDQISVLVGERVPVVSFTFGLFPAAAMAALHDAGSLLVGTATTVEEAVTLVSAGSDLVCAQGSEAGAHRGTFLVDYDQALVGTLALVPQICDAVDAPVLAAGGIMDGRGVAAALALGAAAAQMGTAFLISDEAIISPAWRGAIETASDDPTRLTRALTGRYARGLENRFMREMRAVEREVPAYPVQNRLTQPLRAAATQAGDPQMLSLWAGQAVRLAARGPAADLVRRWWDEAREAARETAQRTGI